MKKVLLFIAFFYFLNFSFVYSQDSNAHHDIRATISTGNSAIEVLDRFVLPPDYRSINKDGYIFLLNKNLSITEVSGGTVTKLPVTGEEEKPVSRYRLVPDRNAKDFTLKYKGIINDKIEKSAAEYARGFSETSGIISDNGVYLADSSYWLPDFGENLLSSFLLDVSIDSGWQVVSQGKRIVNETSGNYNHIVYDSPEPMDEIYLIAARWTEYDQTAGDVLLQAFLRTPDKELADKYLGATGAYLKMYETLIGKYPYSKFALVENFWETGYGMPSFTLLGEKVIRFPWILYSSYPHELLHNYWGNGVFVNYSEGNWCEGITAYMADHLLQEQRGQGAVYRRNTLQKFTDYVNSDNDMPVKQFLNRNNAAEEAIGYGKVLMINEMLRYRLGDAVFLDAYRKFYKDNLFKKVSFPEIEKSFEAVSGKDLSGFFNQWVNRTGAPEIKIENVKVRKKAGGYHISFSLKQVQSEDVFSILVPVAIFTENSVVHKQISMKQRSQNYSFELKEEPVEIQIDPQFNVMRRLLKGEVPAALSQVFGARELYIVVPEKSELKAAYQQMAQTWKSSQEAQGKKAVILSDDQLKSLPENAAVWVLGFENRFNPNALKSGYADFFNENDKETIARLEKSGALVYAIPNEKNAGMSVGFAGADSEKTIQALTRKLLHYGKYGYLGFEGDAAKNVLKGSLPVKNSPLHVKLAAGKSKAKITPRKALYQPESHSGHR